MAVTTAGGTAATPDGPSPAVKQREEPDTHRVAQQRPERVQKLRERLAALVAERLGRGGEGAKEYGLAVHGKQLTADHVDTMEDSEIEKLYARYEARLGATLGSAAIQLYAGVAFMFLPIPAENQPGLVADLEDDPFVGDALSTTTCDLYHRYGWYMAPLAAAR